MFLCGGPAASVAPSGSSPRGSPTNSSGTPYVERPNHPQAAMSHMGHRRPWLCQALPQDAHPSVGASSVTSKGPPPAPPRVAACAPHDHAKRPESRGSIVAMLGLDVVFDGNNDRLLFHHIHAVIRQQGVVGADPRHRLGMFVESGHHPIPVDTASVVRALPAEAHTINLGRQHCGRGLMPSEGPALRETAKSLCRPPAKHRYALQALPPGGASPPSSRRKPRARLW